MERSHTKEHVLPMLVLRDDPLTNCCAFEQVVVLYEFITTSILHLASINLSWTPFDQSSRLLTFQRGPKQNSFVVVNFPCLRNITNSRHLRMPDLEPRFQNSTFHHSLALVAQWLVIWASTGKISGSNPDASNFYQTILHLATYTSIFGGVALLHRFARNLHL